MHDCMSANFGTIDASPAEQARAVGPNGEGPLTSCSGQSTSSAADSTDYFGWQHGEYDSFCK